MDRERVEKELLFIRRTMEASTRYTNVPAAGHLVAGVLGLIGPAATYELLGKQKVLDPDLITQADAVPLALLWGAIFIVAAGASLAFVILSARKNKIAAWSPPAFRMFSSQAPQAFVGVIITLALVLTGMYVLIPAWWLMSYGLILFSFHYYTGPEHFWQSLGFIVIGALAAFSPGWLSLILLAVGFGVINLVAGGWRHIKGETRDET